MDIWFTKAKALYFSEELLALLYDLINEINKDLEKNFTENEVRLLSNEFLNAINTKVLELKKDQKYNDPRFLSFFQMAMVAIIDDSFLTLSWSGRQYWASYLLEMRLFSTRSAGDIFFENCRLILQSGDEKSKELALIYYKCLAAGFRGRFLDVEFNQEINIFKVDLYNLFHDPKSEDPEFINAALLPSEYAPSKSKQLLMQKYSFFNKLLLLNVLIIVVFVIASYFVWFHNANLIFHNL